MGADADLTRRMAVTVALSLLVDLAFLAVVASLLGPWLAPVRAAVTAALPFGGAPAALVWWAAVLGPALVASVWAQLRYTRRRALAAVDATPATRESHPDLLARVRRLAQVADVAAPTVAVSPSETPNSFAVGTLGDATVVVSEGLLARLDGDELDAVLAHEIAHVANRDATVMTLATFLPALTNGEFGPLERSGGRARVALLAGLAVAVLALVAHALPGAPGVGPASLLWVAPLAALTVLVGGVALGALTAPVVYLGRSLSRYREFAADAAAARMTGSPAALAAALRRLDADARPPDADARRAPEVTRALCLLPHGFDADAERSRFYVEARSHPPTAERIERLKAAV